VTTVGELDRKFQIGKVKSGLKDLTELSDAVDGGHIANTILVRSLVTTFPDYLLATVGGPPWSSRGRDVHAWRSVSPEFAGMTYSDTDLSQYPLVSPADAKKLLAENGIRALAQPELVWGWSTWTNSPFDPMWKVSTANGDRCVTSTGRVVESPELQAPARP
jgi:hypothetical protein